MTDQIPDAAVEAAARAHQASFAGLGHMQWDDLWQVAKDRRLVWMCAALEAAAPHMEPTIKPKDFYRIQAMALREAFHEFPLETITAPDNAAVWMKNRADELDHKAERA